MELSWIAVETFTVALNSMAEYRSIILMVGLIVVFIPKEEPDGGVILAFELIKMTSFASLFQG
ncbi:unnamed protein product, partial [marine sediment metagenome]